MSTKRICKKEMKVTHAEGRAILHQLKRNPEVCENCKIKPCVFALYLYGDQNDS